MRYLLDQEPILDRDSRQVLDKIIRFEHQYAEVLRPIHVLDPVSGRHVMLPVGTIIHDYFVRYDGFIDLYGKYMGQVSYRDLAFFRILPAYSPDSPQIRQYVSGHKEVHVGEPLYTLF